MARISDIIELFIKELLDEAHNQSVEIQRNELANYFNCAPSQINYVLTTRFSLDKGYLIESRRGGGGYIKIVQINIDRQQHIKLILDQVGNSIGKMKATGIINVLKNRELITERECIIMRAAISDRTINTPVNIKDDIRANIVKGMIIALFNDCGRE
ncbi:CtsR family transcriptional regulator [Lutibacter sp. B2]|nr:CtsR family transcriptional regulator [Lutibacter sp. B2]